jgi:SAM-dependent methyltransferase
VSDLQHPDSRAFELVADVYERGRPGYPREAVEWLADKADVRAGRTVLDLGAGTGKLMRALSATGARVVAVEPGEQMLAELRRMVPEVEALLGAAEAIPLPDESVDAVAVGQAFHWFRHDEALPEIHRVLRPGGALALIWNERDRDDPLQGELSELLAPFVPPNRPDSSTWVEPLVASGLFGDVERAQFAFGQEMDADGLVDRMMSVSFVAAASADRRAGLAAGLRNVAGARGGRVTLAYVTAVYVCNHRPAVNRGRV